MAVVKNADLFACGDVYLSHILPEQITEEVFPK